MAINRIMHAPIRPHPANRRHGSERLRPPIVEHPPTLYTIACNFFFSFFHVARSHTHQLPLISIPSMLTVDCQHRPGATTPNIPVMTASS